MPAGKNNRNPGSSSLEKKKGLSDLSNIQLKASKLMVIMFTDIVGYTALMEKDGAKALNLVKRNLEIHKPAIRKYGGKFIKEIGDATLSIFPSSSAAIRCAKDIISSTDKIEDLTLRIGIHLGEIQFSENDVYGDGVNIASRIQEEAKPGTISISGGLADSIKSYNDIQLIPLGFKKLKNVRKPVELFQVLTGEAYPVRSTLKKRFKPVHVGYIVLVFLLISMSRIFVNKYYDNPRSDFFSASEIKVAVLPYTQLYEDSMDDYIGFYIADEIRESLKANNHLMVILEESSVQLAGMSTMEIRKYETATHLIKGEYTSRNNEFLINSRIEDVNTGKQFELDKQKCRIDHIGAAANSIYVEILDLMKIKSDSSDNIESNAHLIQQDAYLLFQQGKYMMNKYTSEGLKSAKDLFTEAILLDSQFAEAYAARAYTCLQSATWLGDESQNIAINQAFADIDKALTIDNIPLAYEASGLLKGTYLWDFKNAEKDFKKAMELNKGIPSLEYGALLWTTGRYDKSVESHEYLMQFDPLNTGLYAELGLAYFLAGRKREAYYIYEKALLMEPRSALVNHIMSQFYLVDKEYEKAREYAKIVTQESPEKWPFDVLIDGLIYAVGGDVENTLKTIEKLNVYELQGLSGWSGLSCSKALLYALLGEKKHALDLFQEAINKREINTPVFTYAWLDLYGLSEIRDDNFLAMMRKAGLIFE